MGGHVGVDSTVGQGSTFWFTARLPVDRSAAVPAPPVAATVAAAAVSDGRRRHVLVAEDNDVNQMVIGEMLRRLGYDCDLVANGRAAVDAVVAGRFEPGADGLPDAGDGRPGGRRRHPRRRGGRGVRRGVRRFACRWWR